MLEVFEGGSKTVLIRMVGWGGAAQEDRPGAIRDLTSWLAVDGRDFVRHDGYYAIVLSSI